MSGPVAAIMARTFNGTHNTETTPLVRPWEHTPCQTAKAKDHPMKDAFDLWWDGRKNRTRAF